MTVILPGELVNLRLDIGSDDVIVSFKLFGFDLIVKVTDVSNNGVVLHLGHMLNSDDSLVSSGSHIDVNLIEDIFDSDNFKTFHACLEGADRVNLSNVNSGA